MITSLLMLVAGAACPVTEQDVVAVINLAETRRREARYGEARRRLEAASPCVTEGHPLHGVLANNLAQVYKVTGPRDKVEGLLRTALRAWRGSEHAASALTNLADWYESNRKLSRAEALYREVVASYPGVPVHHNNLGALLHRRQRYLEAEQHYRRALELYESRGSLPGARQTWGNLGLLLAKQKRDPEAIAAFDRMAEYTPPPAEEKAHGVCLEVYATVLRRQQEPAAAERMSAAAMRYRVRQAIRQTRVNNE